MKRRALTASEMRGATDAGIAWAWQLESELAALYEKRITAAYARAATLLPRVAALSKAGGLTAASGKWSIPDADELGLALKKQTDARHETGSTGIPQRDNAEKTDAIRVEAARRATAAGLELMNISLDTRNPLVEGVLASQLGGNIAIDETTRRGIMASLEDSWRTGKSIANAAKALREQAVTVSKSRAETIARTEILTAVNGGAHALGVLSNEIGLQLGQPPLLKIWLSAQDALVRDDHVEAADTYAAGAGIPMDEAFIVGGAEMMYPGDQDGPADEVINCRCALSYEEGASLTASMGGTMETYKGRPLNPTGALTAGGWPIYEFADLPSIVPEDATPIGGNEPDSREWTAVLCLEGIATSDGRMLGIDAVEWRELPLTLMAQITTDEQHRGAIIAGRIDAIEKTPTAAAISAGLLEDREEGYPPDAVAVIGRGVFDNSWSGDDVMRLVGEKTLRGVSVDLAPERVELVELPADPENPNDVAGGYLEIVTLGKIMGATVCPFPAFAEAVIHVETVGEEAGETSEEPILAALRARRALRVVVNAPIVAAAPRVYSAVDYSGSSMVATSPTSAQCMGLALPGGQPAGDLHVTLAYLPDPDAVDFDALHKVVAGVAAAHDAIEGKVGGAGYFAPESEKPGDKKTDTEPDADEAAADAGVSNAAAATPETLAATPPAVAGPETDPDSEEEPNDGTPPAGPLHPHVALVDAPGLGAMRAALCSALDDAGVAYATNHDFTPHITLGYEAQPGVPAMHHGGKPLSFGAITVHQGPTKTDHPMGPAEGVTASAAGLAPDAPPLAWFDDPGLVEPTPLTVTPEGRIYGHLATWGTCHIGHIDECVRPPESLTEYALFHLGHVITEEGELVPVGTLTLDTGHADLHLGSTAARMHYDHTGTQVADVRVGDDETGIWFAGAIRPELDTRALRKLRASRISGDWRPHDGTRELVAALAVNVGGFPVVRPRTAIAASGRLMGLVAAGIDLAPPPVSAGRTRVLELAERARPGYLDERREALLSRARG